jgi:glutamine synthetase
LLGRRLSVVLRQQARGAIVGEVVPSPVDEDRDPGDPGAGSSEELPPTLLHAVEAFTANPVVTGALGGPEIAAYYAAYKREEFLTWHSQVGTWETDQYLTAF